RTQFTPKRSATCWRDAPRQASFFESRTATRIGWLSCRRDDTFICTTRRIMQVSMSPGELLILTCTEVPCPENYAFVVNVHSIGDGTSLRLTEWHTLRRANDFEIQHIREVVRPFIQVIQPRDSYWEDAWPHGQGEFQQLPAAEWRYFVITFPLFDQPMPTL